MSRPRLKEVAVLAEVSEPTVSRVLNGKPGVAEATRQRVVAALKELGFEDVPEPSSVRPGVIGIVCGDLTNPVFPTLVHQISSELAKHDQLVTVAVRDRNVNPEQRCIQEFVETGVGGVIFLGGRHAEIESDLSHCQELVDIGRAAVFVNGRHTDLPIPHVRCDEEEGAAKAVRHLHQLGHRRIGCLLGSSVFIPTKRYLAGYRRALDQLGADEPEGAVAESVFTLEGGRAGASRLINQGITGIICGNDLMALGAVQAADRAGCKVPSDVSVVGYDGAEFTSYTSPSLTTLRQPFEDMAYLISNAVLNEIGGGDTYRDHYVFEPELVARGSSGTFHP